MRKWLLEFNKYEETIPEAINEKKEKVLQLLMPNREIAYNIIRIYKDIYKYYYPSFFHAEALLAMQIIYDIPYWFEIQEWSPYWASGIWTTTINHIRVRGKKFVTKQWRKTFKIDESKYRDYEWSDLVGIWWQRTIRAEKFDSEVVFDIEPDKQGRKYSYLEKNYWYPRTAPRYVGTILMYYEDYEIYAVDENDELIYPLQLLGTKNISTWYDVHMYARLFTAYTGYEYRNENESIDDKRVNVLMDIDKVASS